MTVPAAHWVKHGSQIALVGHLDFGNLVALLREADSWLATVTTESCTLNLAGVTHSNSAGAALIVGLRRRANGMNKHLNVEQVPDNLISILRLGGMDWLLGEAAATN